jgi:hypothetical protein
MGTLTSWNPLGHSRPVMGLFYLFFSRQEQEFHVFYPAHRRELTTKQLAKYRKSISKGFNDRSGVYLLYEVTTGAPFPSTARGISSSCQFSEGPWDTQLQTLCLKELFLHGVKRQEA